MRPTTRTFSAVISVCLAACTEEPPPIPDLSGIWARNNLRFEQPASGPGPLVDLSPSAAIVGDYNNPILKAAAAQQVKRLGDIELSGVAFPEPENQCVPWPVPNILRQMKIRILQQPDRVTILYRSDQQVRRIRMNESHPANVIPSVYGDSIGSYDGDALVIDTVGVKVGPFAMVDGFGTPYSEALHVVERYRLIDYQAGKAAIEEHEAKYGRIPPDVSGIAIDPDYRGKALQIEFIVDDPNVFTTSWKALVTYRRAASEWPEYICAENLLEPDGVPRKVPTAEAPDF
jgi:hypothetical protein